MKNTTLCSTGNLACSTFRNDVTAGLSADQKFLEAKYFYDEEGDKLFQEIMRSPEYYLTDCELEILQRQSAAILKICAAHHTSFDIIELGAGDASKSIHLLKEASLSGLSNHYFPIDISAHIISHLEQFIPGQVPDMFTQGLQGEYFDMLDQAGRLSEKPKLVLFLGATIGNMLPDEALAFFKTLQHYLNPGDLLLTGFDLKKNPVTILSAYNDKAGITRAFNLNLLKRINRELGGNFIVSNFTHYPVYDPGTGACKSYLISTAKQEVSLKDGTTFYFEKDEAIYMEVSQKYDVTAINEMAEQSGFQALTSFYDSKKMFTDSLWKLPY